MLTTTLFIARIYCDKVFYVVNTSSCLKITKWDLVIWASVAEAQITQVSFELRMVRDRFVFPHASLEGLTWPLHEALVSCSWRLARTETPSNNFPLNLKSWMFIRTSILQNSLPHAILLSPHSETTFTMKAYSDNQGRRAWNHLI